MKTTVRHLRPPAPTDTPATPVTRVPLPAPEAPTPVTSDLHIAAAHERRTEPRRHVLPTIPGYEILSVLGRGGMGIVYKARQLGVNRLVALKVILAGDHADDEDVRRFFQEAEAIGTLKHPNIVQVYEVGEYDGRPFLSLEYVDGGTLYRRIHRQPQSPVFAAAILETVADAVHAAHVNGIVHRDLKPANILLQATPEEPEGSRKSSKARMIVPVAKITDFGLAKRFDDPRNLTVTGQIAGTPTYMAPEQCRGDRAAIGAASDIWALGVILYEMLTGETPFAESTPAQTMSDVLLNSPESPRRRRAEIPLDLETICLKCLEKSPARRYASAQDLANDLRRFREGRPIEARRVNAAELAWRWCRRNPVVSLLVAGLMFTFATGAGVASAYALKASENAAQASAYAIQADENATQAREQQARAEESAREATARAAEATAARQEESRQKAIATGLAEQATEREARGLRERYALDANLAMKSWEAGDVRLARQFLARTLPAKESDVDFRGFEWHYLDHLCHREKQTVPLGHRILRALAVLPGGRRLAYSTDSVIRFWHRDDGHEKLTLNGHTDQIVTLAVHPSLPCLASGSYDGTIRIWNIDTGRQLHVLKGSVESVFSLVFSADGKTLYSGGGRHRGGFAPGEIVYWDAETGERKQTLKHHEGAVNAIALSPDGTTLASVSYDRVLALCDARTGELRRCTAFRHGLISVAFHPKMPWVAVGGDLGPIAIVDSNTGTVLRELHGHKDWARRLAFTPDGHRLVSGGHDGTVRIWKAHTGELEQTLRGHAGAIFCMTLLPGGAELATIGEDDQLKLWEPFKTPEQRHLGKAIGEVVHARVIHEGRKLLMVTQFGEVVPHDAHKFDVVSSITNITESNLIRRVDVSKPFDLVTAVTHVDKLRLHSLSGQAIPEDLRALKTGSGLLLSDDGRWVAYLPDSYQVQIIDRQNPGKPKTAKLNAFITGLAMSSGPEPVIAAATHIGALFFIRPITSKVHGLMIDDGGELSKLAFAPDGKTLAGADQLSRVRLWETATGREVWCSEAHSNTVNSLVFSPRGDRLASASADLTVKLLDTVTGRETLTLRGHTRSVCQAIFTSDGHSIITFGGDFDIRRWEAEGAVRREFERCMSRELRITNEP